MPRRSALRAQGAQRRAGRSQPKTRAATESPLPDLWNIPDVRLPGSPTRTPDDSVDVLIHDVRGNRVRIAEKKHQKYKNTGTEPDTWMLWVPIEAPDLWTGSRHHALSHALRLFQVCSCTFEEHQRTGERKLRGKITARELLEYCGASHEMSYRLVEQLLEIGLLRAESLGSYQPEWFVKTNVRGIGPNLQFYEMADVPEFVLPEFVGASATKPNLQRASEPEADDVTEGDDAGMSNDDAGALGADGASAPDADQTPEQNVLLKLYEVILALVPEGITSDHAGHDGLVGFTLKGDFKAMLSEKLGVTPHEVSKQLKLLMDAGVYRAKAGGHAQPWVRYLRLDAEQQVSAIDYKLGSAKKATTASTKKTARRAQRPAAAETKGTEVTPEQMIELLTQLKQALEERDSCIDSLTQELTAAKLELEDAQASRVSFTLPEGLEKYLNND